MSIIFGGTVLGAQEANKAGYEDRTGLGGPADNERLMVEETTAKETVFEEFILPRWETFKKDVKDRSGLQFSINYSFAYLNASDVLKGQERDGAGGIFDLTGSWKLPFNDGSNAGIIGFRLEDRHKLWTEATPAALGPATGSLWKPNILFGEFDLVLSQLWYEHQWDDKRYVLRLGKLITPIVLYDNHLLKVPNFLFENDALTTGGIPFPSNGLGAIGGAWINDRMYLYGGVHDANGSPSTDGFDTFFDVREFFSAVEIGFTPSRKEAKVNNIHLTLWHKDAIAAKGLPSGWGFALAAQKFWDEKWLGLFRFSYSDSGLTATESLASVAIGRKLRSHDVLAAGLSWGTPSDDNLDDQLGLEAFYRIHVTPRTSIIPTLHVFFSPSNNPDEDVIVVAGVRARVSL